MLARGLRSEVVADKCSKKDLICFSVEQMNPSQKSVRALRQQNLNLCSAAPWPKGFNGGFDVSEPFISLDASQSAKVPAEVQGPS